MDRRLFLRVLAKGTVYLALGATSLFLLNSKRYYVRDFYTSRLFPHRKFTSKQEFWADHYDRIGDETNTHFVKSHRLVSKRSFLLDDQRTVVVEQVFANKADYMLREYVKRALSKDSGKESNLLHVEQKTGFLA